MPAQLLRLNKAYNASAKAKFRASGGGSLSRLQSCLWSRREILLRTKDRIYQTVVRSILLCGCEAWPVRVADQRMLVVFENDSIRRILHVRRRDCVPKAALQLRLRLASIRVQLVQRRLCWFGHAARCPEGELIRDLLSPIPPSSETWSAQLAMVAQPAPSKCRHKYKYK